MPIDSSIPLQAQAPKPANWAETMMPYVQMAGAMQNIKESQARMPGLEADAANKARSAAAQKWLQDNSAKYTSPDGKVDSVSLVEAFKKAGFPDFAQQYAQQDAKTSSDYAAARSAQAKAMFAEGAEKAAVDRAQAEATAAQQQTLTNTWGHLSTFLAGLPEEQQAQMYQNARSNLIKQNPTIFNDATLPPEYGPQVRKALETGSMTPKEKGTLDISAGHLRVSEANVKIAQNAQAADFAASAYTPEGRDPNSQVSKQMRDFARQQGIEVPEGLSAFDIKTRYPSLGAAVGTATASQAVPQGTRAEAVTKAAQLSATIKSYDDALNAARDLKQDFGDDKISVLRTKYGSRLTGDPRLARMMTAVQIHNSLPEFKDKQIDPETMSPSQVFEALRSGQQIVANAKVGQEELARTKTFPSNKPSPNQSPSQPKQSSNEPKKGDPVTRNGVTYIFLGGDPDNKNNWYKK